MRTNIVLDDNIVEEAFKYSKSKTKKDLIREALVEYVENKKRKTYLSLKVRLSFLQKCFLI